LSNRSNCERWQSSYWSSPLHARQVEENFCLDNPGRRSDIGETIEQTLRREVAEEVNITDLEILDFIGEVPGAKEGDVVLMFYCTTKQDGKLMEPEKFFRMEMDSD